MMSREEQFRDVCESLKAGSRATADDCLVVAGDSLKALKKMPSASVSLILTDPPYHATKKKNIYGDTAFEHDKKYIEWMRQYSNEWRRILKPNGCFFCFCASSMAAKLEVMFEEQFNILSNIVWTKPNAPGFDGWKGKMKKEALRQWYPHSERIIFAEPALEGNLHRSAFADLLKKARTKAGLSGHKLTEMTGAYGKVNHGGAVSNWETGRNIPSREQYRKLCDAIQSTGKIDAMPLYEDAVRPFKIDKSKEFTDVWDFTSVRPYKGKHPAEKPLDMLEHAIGATTFEGDIVLDCFAGSGNTAFAALKLNRRAVVMEFEESWLSAIERRLEISKAAPELQISRSDARVVETPQAALF